MIFCGQNQANNFTILFNKIELLEGKCCAFFEGHHILLSNLVWISSPPTLNLSSTNDDFIKILKTQGSFYSFQFVLLNKLFLFK